MDEKVRRLLRKLIGDVGYLLDEVELISGVSGEVDEYVVSVETVEELRTIFMELRGEAVWLMKNMEKNNA